MNAEQIKTRVRSFLGGPYYPLLVITLALVGHSTNLEVWFGIAMLLTMVVGCWLCYDFRFAISPFLCTILFVTADHSPNVPSYSRYYLQPSVLIPLCIVAGLILISFVAFAVRNFKTRNKLSFGGLFGGILIFCAALLLNGAFSQNYKISNAIFAAGFLLSLLAVYYLFTTFVRFDKKTVDYVMYCLALSCFLIILELLFAYLTSVRFSDGSPVKESVVLGWGVWTTVGGMLLFLMPTAFYFATDHKHGWLGYLLGLLSFVAVFLSQSRGALLVGGGVLVLCLILLCFIGQNRKKNRIYALVLLGVGLLGCIVLKDKILSLLQNFLRFGFDDNGRFEIWQIGWKHFLDDPIFGSGFYDSYYNEGWIKNLYPYLYHNTVIQLLGSAGMIGFATYLYHRVTTVFAIFRKPNTCKLFLGISILGLVTFSLLDVLFFHTYPIIFYAVMLVAINGSDNA